MEWDGDRVLAGRDEYRRRPRRKTRLGAVERQLGEVVLTFLTLIPAACQWRVLAACSQYRNLRKREAALGRVDIVLLVAYALLAQVGLGLAAVAAPLRREQLGAAAAGLLRPRQSVLHALLQRLTVANHRFRQRRRGQFRERDRLLHLSIGGGLVAVQNRSVRADGFVEGAGAPDAGDENGSEKQQSWQGGTVHR